MDKKVSRLKRARRGRAKIRELRVMRLCVHRTPQHIYAQVFDPQSRVVVAASTVQKEVAGELKATGNVDAAKAVGKAIAERARAKGITQVAFDRSGFRYHGRVKALADAAREKEPRPTSSSRSS
jgi:large subunit ribosomal protein L18